MAKTIFKKGDVVKALPNDKYSITREGWIGIVTKQPTNSIYINVREYNLETKEIVARSSIFHVESKHFKKYNMATKKKDETIVVVEGDYFTATYKRKKIRGIVGSFYNRYDDVLILFNNQSGNDLKCNDNNKSGFSNGIEIGNVEDDSSGTLAGLKEVGVTNYIVLKDRRQKAVIDKDKMPEISVSNSDFRVSVEGDKFVIGCGAVELTKKQIEGYLRFRENREDLDYYDNTYIEDMELAEIEEYVRIKKTFEKGDGALYKQVIDAADGEEYDEDDVNNIDEDDIKALFKYATHVAAGV